MRPHLASKHVPPTWCCSANPNASLVKNRRFDQTRSHLSRRDRETKDFERGLGTIFSIMSALPKLRDLMRFSYTCLSASRGFKSLTQSPGSLQDLPPAWLDTRDVGIATR